MARRVDAKQERRTIRDFIYFDLAKAASMLSQVEGGVVAETETSRDKSEEDKSAWRFDIKVLQSELGGAESETRRTVEKRIAYHEIFGRLENTLSECGMVLNVNSTALPGSISDGSVHEQVRSSACCRVTGWTYFEDFSRMCTILERFNSISRFVVRCSALANPDFLEVQSQIEEVRIAIDTVTNKTDKARLRQQLSASERQIKAIEERLVNSLAADDDLLRGIREFIETFMPNRMSLIVYPFADSTSFQVGANLKRECFIDTDVDNLIYAYGTRPDLPLTVFGIPTSVPLRTDDRADPYSFSDGSDEADVQSGFEQGFRQVFKALEDLESLVRFSRFPRVTLYPIAVYRENVQV